MSRRLLRVVGIGLSAAVFASSIGYAFLSASQSEGPIVERPRYAVVWGAGEVAALPGEEQEALFDTIDQGFADLDDHAAGCRWWCHLLGISAGVVGSVGGCLAVLVATMQSPSASPRSEPEPGDTTTTSRDQTNSFNPQSRGGFLVVVMVAVLSLVTALLGLGSSIAGGLGDAADSDADRKSRIVERELDQLSEAATQASARARAEKVMSLFEGES